MTDQILIKDLLLRTIVGTKADERVNKQDVVINIILDVDLRAAGESDQIEDTVNYRTITKNVIEFVEESDFLLVEKLATEISKICLVDPRVAAAEVCVEKPGALRFARSVGVVVRRKQGELRESTTEREGISGRRSERS